MNQKKLIVEGHLAVDYVGVCSFQSSNQDHLKCCVDLANETTLCHMK